jgi:hypothetical protein
MPAQKRRRMDDLVTPSLDGADEINEHTIPRAGSLENGEQFPQSASELHQNWAPTSDLKRYLYHTTPEEFVKRINSLISPDLAVGCHSSYVMQSLVLILNAQATIFNRYTTQLAPHLPAVVFPAGTTAEQVFKER